MSKKVPHHAYEKRGEIIARLQSKLQNTQDLLDVVVEQNDALLSKLEKLQDQDEVHWKTRRKLLKDNEELQSRLERIRKIAEKGASEGLYNSPLHYEWRERLNIAHKERDEALSRLEKIRNAYEDDSIDGNDFCLIVHDVLEISPVEREG